MSIPKDSLLNKYMQKKCDCYMFSNSCIFCCTTHFYFDEIVTELIEKHLPVFCLKNYNDIKISKIMYYIDIGDFDKLKAEICSGKGIFVTLKRSEYSEVYPTQEQLIFIILYVLESLRKIRHSKKTYKKTIFNIFVKNILIRLYSIEELFYIPQSDLDDFIFVTEKIVECVDNILKINY